MTTNNEHDPLIFQLILAMFAGWISRSQQQTIEYLKEENKILKARLDNELGGRRLILTINEKRRLAVLGKALGRKCLKEVCIIFSPDTILKWYSQIVAQKFDSSKNRPKMGRPRKAKEIEELVVKISIETPGFGFKRIAGAMENLGFKIDKITVRNILMRHGIDPSPKRKEGAGSWSQFIKTHMDVLAATDFFTIPVATWHGIIEYYVLFFIELNTRAVHIAGMTPNPNEKFMAQIARQITDDFDGFLNGRRYLIHDRDTKYCKKFRDIVTASDIELIKLPRRSPDLNAFTERFVLSAKSECFNNMIVFGERGLRHSMKNFAEHYHKERNHQGIANKIINPDTEIGGISRNTGLREVLNYI